MDYFSFDSRAGYGGCNPISSFLKEEYRKEFGDIIDIVSTVVHNTSKRADEYVDQCITKIKEGAEKGLREFVVGTINNLGSFLNLVFRKTYYEAVERIKRKFKRMVIRRSDLMMLVLENLMPWISSVAERIRRVLEPYHSRLGIRDFSLSVQVSAPFVQVYFGLTITFNI